MTTIYTKDIEELKKGCRKKDGEEEMKNKKNNIVISKMGLAILLIGFLIIGIGISILVQDIFNMTKNAYTLESKSYRDIFFNSTNKGVCLGRIPIETKVNVIVCYSDIQSRK